MKPTNSCECDKCQSACQHRAGFFAHGEIELAANLKNMTTKEFFDKYLAVDWWQGNRDSEDVFVIAPAIKSQSNGSMYPADPRGECIFFIGGKCDIHDAKPMECAKYVHTQNKSESEEVREYIRDTWIDKQDEIKELLGYQPYSSEIEGS